MIESVDLPTPFSRQHALAAGNDDRDIRRHCRSGRWQRVRRGWYVQDLQSEVTTEERHRIVVHALTPAVSSDAVVSHASAAVLHGLQMWGIPLSKVHVTRNRRAGARSTRRTVVHASSIAPDEVAVVDGIRVTSVARTVVDLARSQPMDAAVALGDAALRMRFVTRDELEAQRTRMQRSPGSRSAARAIAAMDGRSESVGESRSRLILHAAGWRPKLQAEVRSADGTFVARVDFLFAELGVIGEFDGVAKYQSGLRGVRTPEQVVIAEKTREDRLRALGWIVVRWTWDDLEHPASLLARLQSAMTIAECSQRAGTWQPASA